MGSCHTMSLTLHDTKLLISSDLLYNLIPIVNNMTLYPLKQVKRRDLMLNFLNRKQTTKGYRKIRGDRCLVV